MRRRRACGRCLHRSSDDCPAPKSPWPATGSAALFSRLRRKQLMEVLIDLADRIRIGAEQREMSVNGLDRPELGVAADIAALPLPRHAQQIIWVHDAEIAIHEVDDEIVH